MKEDNLSRVCNKCQKPLPALYIVFGWKTCFKCFKSFETLSRGRKRHEE